MPGGHGFGMHKQGLLVDNWIEQFGEWLNEQGFFKYLIFVTNRLLLVISQGISV